MRINSLIEHIKNYEWNKVLPLVSEERINGGWEVWLQVELALYLKGYFPRYDVQIQRERKYPGKDERCDFYLTYGTTGIDPAYIELKCQNPFHDNPLRDVIKGFADDIDKAKDLGVLAGCMAVCYGSYHDICALLVEKLDESDLEQVHMAIYDPVTRVLSNPTNYDNGGNYIVIIGMDVFYAPLH